MHYFSLMPTSTTPNLTPPTDTAKPEPNHNHQQNEKPIKMLQCINGACDATASDTVRLGQTVGGVHETAYSNGNLAKKPRKRANQGPVSSLDSSETLPCLPSDAFRGQNGNNGLPYNESSQNSESSPYVCGNCNLLKNVGKSYR